MKWEMITETGRVQDNFFLLGNPLLPVYFLKGSRFVLIDSAMTFMAPVINSQISEITGGEGRLNLNLITHIHFDHCGGTPALLKMNSALETASSEFGAELLKKEKVIKHMARLNREAAQNYMGKNFNYTKEIEFEKFEISHPLKDGDEIEVDRGSIMILSSPGHTNCSLCYYIKEVGAVIAGEALGVPFLTGEVQPEFLSDYDDYLNSLKRISSLDPDMVCLAHGGIIKGKSAKLYLKESIEATETFREKVEKLLHKYGDEEKVVSEIAAEEYHPSKTTQIKPAYLLNLKAKVNCIKKRMIRQRLLPQQT